MCVPGCECVCIYMHAHTHPHTVYTHTGDISHEMDLGSTERWEGCARISLKHSEAETTVNCVKIKMKNKQR